MKALLATALLSLFITAPSYAGNWPGWRGPNSNGVAEGSGYPVSWDSSKNILWEVKFPGPSGSTPVIWGDDLFLTTNAGGKNRVICLNKNTGKEKWHSDFGAEDVGKHKKGSGSSPSPAVDDQFVFGYFKSGDLACLTKEGKIVWQKNLQKEYGEDTLWWDLGTSPVLTDNLVVIACIQSDNSYIAAFDKATGKEVWKQSRNLDAPKEANQSYSTPVVVKQNGKETIYVLGADHVTAHDAQSGKEIWRVGGLNPTQHEYFRSISSPVVSDGYLIAPYARGGSLTGIKLGGQGDVTKSNVVWTNEGEGKGAFSDVPTPAAINGRLYVCSDRGEVLCFDIKTGKKIWDGRLPRSRHKFSASPILADGHIYVTREDGTTLVLEQGDEFKLASENPLEGFALATPVFSDGKIYLKMTDKLYCIGKK